VPLPSDGQLHWASTVLEEELQAPGYVVHKIAVWRPTVSMTISGVCRYLQSGNYTGQFPYGQGATAAAAVAEEETTLGPPADQGELAAAPPADQAVAPEEDGSGGVEDSNLKKLKEGQKSLSFFPFFFFINSVLYAPLGSEIISSLLVSTTSD
jgi:hypothetical protein